MEPDPHSNSIVLLSLRMEYFHAIITPPLCASTPEQIRFKFPIPPHFSGSPAPAAGTCRGKWQPYYHI
jgi:hypothetical protein